MIVETIHEKHYGEVKRITLIGALIHVLLGISKIFFGIVGHSQALFADGIHSISDLLTDGLVLLASYYGSQAADADHPYGHKRIETLATVLLSVLIMAVGVAIMGDALWHAFYEKKIQAPHFSVLCVASISLLANEMIYRITTSIANRIHSDLLHSNAWHSRSDAASSFIVLLGAVGAILGFYFLDSVAAGIVGIIIIKMGWRLGWSGLRELVDTGLDETQIQEIKKTLLNVSGILAIHDLRTRSMGGYVLADVHLQVMPHLSVSEGHFIAEKARDCLLHAVKHLLDVTIHIDSEDDHLYPSCLDLPDRRVLEKELALRWAPWLDKRVLDYMVLHYRQGKIFIELLLSLADIQQEDAQILQKKLRHAVIDYPVIASVDIFLKTQ